MTKQQLLISKLIKSFYLDFSIYNLYTTRTFLGVLKRFLPINRFAIVKLVNLKIYKDHKDDLYILRHPGAKLSKDVIDRIIKFKVEIYIPRFYKICIFLLIYSRCNSKHLKTAITI